jgi:hypothetical protein
MAASETARDLADEYFQASTLPPHTPQNIMLSLDDGTTKQTGNPQTSFLHPNRQKTTDTPLFESYVDDFIAMFQTTSTDTVTHTTRALLHAINDIFPPPSQNGSRLEHPISVKKLKEEGRWSTTKEVLGWLIDGQHKTISLTQEKFNKIQLVLAEAINLPRFPAKKLETIKGKLNWLSDAVITGKPLLGDLDNYFYYQKKHSARWNTLPPHIIHVT